MLLRLTATAAVAATAATAICHLRFRAWHGMAWDGVAAQGGQGLAQKSVSLLALGTGVDPPGLSSMPLEAMGTEVKEGIGQAWHSRLT
jgi:hypothetical protein